MWLLQAFWLPIFLWGYAIISVIFFLFLLLAVLVANSLNPLNNDLGIHNFINNVLVPKREKLRGAAIVFVTTLADSLIWPVPLLTIPFIVIKYVRLFGNSSMRRMPLQAYLLLNPYDVIRVYATLLLIASVIIVGGAYLPNSVMLIFIAHVLLRLLGHCISSEELSERLKKSLVNPYVNFLLIAGGIFSITILSLSGYIYGLQNISPGILLQVARQLLDFSWLSKIEDILGNRLMPNDYFIGVSSILLGIAGLTSIFSWKEFRRTNEDYHSIAHKLLIMGKYNDALKWLDKIKSPQVETSQLQVVAYIGVNQIDKAKDILAELNKGCNEEEIYKLLIEKAYLYSFNPRIIGTLIDSYIDEQPNETELLIMLINLMPNMFIGLSPKEKAQEFVNLLEKKEAQKEYPLVYADMLRKAVRFDEARAILLALPEYNDSARNAIRRLSLLYINLLNPEQSIETWMDEHADVFIRQAAEVADKGNSSDKAAIFILLMPIEKILKEELSHERSEEFSYILSQLQKDVPQNLLHELEAYYRRIQQSAKTFRKWDFWSSPMY
ncbi:MAG: hypothetical protein L6461_07385 [Anaerolineae bacterium]|nr:hypothetical protein [Anaerolineae bacterium]